MEIGSAEFEQMVQDTLDLIEFANGDESSEWGKVRVQLGHKAPFGLEYLGIGNEQWQMDNTDFFARYKIFEQRIHAKYPEIKLIGSADGMLPQIITQMHGSSTERKRRTIQTLFSN